MKASHRFIFCVAAWLLVATSPVATAADTPVASDTPKVSRGRYVVSIGGCNDCHTPGFAANGGATPEAQWLTGDSLGYRGPWGTTYPSNLRTYMQNLTEAQWVKAAKSLKTRPPMPWFSVQRMSDADLRAMYAFIRHLGPGGAPAPAYVSPDKEPSPPFVLFPSPPK